jgi:hypothetical protein
MPVGLREESGRSGSPGETTEEASFHAKSKAQEKNLRTRGAEGIIFIDKTWFCGRLKLKAGFLAANYIEYSA